MSSKTSFVVPNFDKSIKNKVNDGIEVSLPHMLRCLARDGFGYIPAISTNGIPSKTDGVYVFAMKINKAKDGDIMVGFTDTKTCDLKRTGHAGNGVLSGTSLCCYIGYVYPATVEYLSPNITRNAKEIISIFTISNNGKKQEIQWIADGNEGRVADCTKDFGNGDEIFACVALGDEGQQLEFIKFDQVKSRSPKIEELMKECNNKHKQQLISSAPSTSTAENDALISQLREQVARSQDAAVKDRDQMIKDLKQQLIANDQQHRNDLGLSHQQLELERAEHQKTRNLLHQIKMELKDMEIFYLNREKESGQRRQREEGNGEFKVKQEPSE